MIHAQPNLALCCAELWSVFHFTHVWPSGERFLRIRKRVNPIQSSASSVPIDVPVIINVALLQAVGVRPCLSIYLDILQRDSGTMTREEDTVDREVIARCAPASVASRSTASDVYGVWSRASWLPSASSSSVKLAVTEVPRDDMSCLLQASIRTMER